MIVRVQRKRGSCASPCATPCLSGSSMPASASAERATSSARERSSSIPARASPWEKISKPVDITRARSTKATTTSMRVNPASRLALINRDPPGEPIDVDEILALARRNGDAPARGAAVGVEPDSAAALAGHLASGGLELDALRKLARLRLVSDRELPRVEVEHERRVVARRHRGGLRLAKARGER